jgi:hypothetical protein
VKIGENMKRAFTKGEHFGYWEVIQEAKDRKVLCRCRCGVEKEVQKKHLLSGKTTSCGCLRNQKASERMKANNPCIVKHNMHKSKLYGIWSGMKDRCYNSNNIKYQYYGGRGIKVCDEWQGFEPFKEWALNNGYKDGLTIDRQDYDGNYDPCNCRWITIQEQQYNKHNNHLLTYNGRTQTLTEWAKERGIKRNTLDARINRSNWDIGRALGYEC